MTRPYRKYTDTDISFAVACSTSIAQVLQQLSLRPTGANYKGMHANISRLQLNTDHFLGSGHLKGKQHNWSPARPFEEILVENSDYLVTSSLKRRLLKAGMLDNKCAICSLAPEWNGSPLVMILDHINGINNDNRLTNLRLVCPNCNSQLPTHAGKNKGRHSPL